MLPTKYAVHPNTMAEGKELREYYFSQGARQDDFDDPEKYFNGSHENDTPRWFGVITDNIILWQHFWQVVVG